MKKLILSQEYYVQEYCIAQNFDGWTKLKHLTGKILTDCPGPKKWRECLRCIQWFVEVLECIREPGNTSDMHAVTVKKGELTVGHVPRFISLICSIFIQRGGVIKCRITGERQHSADLPQGGLVF